MDACQVRNSLRSDGNISMILASLYVHRTGVHKRTGRNDVRRFVPVSFRLLTFRPYDTSTFGRFDALTYWLFSLCRFDHQTYHSWSFRPRPFGRMLFPPLGILKQSHFHHRTARLRFPHVLSFRPFVILILCYFDLLTFWSYVNPTLDFCPMSPRLTAFSLLCHVTFELLFFKTFRQMSFRPLDISYQCHFCSRNFCCRSLRPFEKNTTGEK